jgi:hypothetical protein
MTAIIKDQLTPAMLFFAPAHKEENDGAYQRDDVNQGKRRQVHYATTSSSINEQG